MKKFMMFIGLFMSMFIMGNVEALTCPSNDGTYSIQFYSSGNYQVMKNGVSCNIVTSTNASSFRVGYCNIMINKSGSSTFDGKNCPQIKENPISSERLASILGKNIEEIGNTTYAVLTFETSHNSGNSDYTEDDYDYINKPDNDLVSCGPLDNVPARLPYIVSMIYNVLKIVVPIVIVIFGMLDLVKAVIAQKEDEIKKGQNIFIKRLIAGCIVFFVMAIVQLVVGVVAGASDSENIISCMRCFLNNKCD